MEAATERLQHYVCTRATLISLLSAALVLLGAFVMLTGVLTTPVPATLGSDDPGTEQTHAVGVSQSVTVEMTGDTEAYRAGEMLTDQSLYPKADASDPVVTAGADAQDARLLELELLLTYESAPSGDTNDPFFTDRRSLVSASPEGDDAELTYQLDVAAAFERQRALREEFGDGTTTDLRLETAVTYEFESSEGGISEETVTVGGSVTDSGWMYAVPSDETQVIERTGTAASTGGGIGVLNALALLSAILGIAGLAMTAVFTRRVDEEKLQETIQRQRFEEWVTEVEAYNPKGTANVVEVTSLNDLVNLAIDINQRVLYHRRLDEYLVADGETLFKYKPDDEGGGATEFFGMDPDDLDIPPAPPDFNQMDEPGTRTED